MILTVLLALAISTSQRMFPVHAETQWTYSATVRWTEEKTNRVREKRMEWRSRIVDAKSNRDRSVMIIEGFPADLSWYQPDQPLQYTVVVEDDKEVRIGRGTTLDRAREIAAGALEGAFDGDTVLRHPAKKGDCIRDPDIDERSDKLYAWCVEDRLPHNGWTITYRSNPSHEILDLTPGKGLTRFVYEHHGTVASAKVRLVKIRVAK